MSDEHPDDERPPSSSDDSVTELDEQLIENLADPVCAFDDTGTFRYTNATFERQTGYDGSDIRGEPLTLAIDKADAQTLLDAATDLRDRTSTTVEISLQLDDDDETKPVECNLSVLDDQETVLVVMRDISEVREREQRLSKFARVVSHDLRNPLDVALGRAEMLPEIADVDPETEQHLHEIYNSLTRMEHLIEDVLTLSRQENDVIDAEPVNLAAVATEAWRTVETSNATLTVQTDAVVSAHRARLRRIFENLFRNSVEHGSTSNRTESDDAVEPGIPNSETDEEWDGNRDVTVEVGLVEEDGENAGFYVADDGPGIDQQDRDRLFEGGYTTSDSGTGLGLTIVREIVHAHEWSVGLGSQADGDHLGGARFEITDVSFLPDTEVE
jgi:PAS domain S-box-containing protein